MGYRGVGLWDYRRNALFQQPYVVIGVATREQWEQAVLESGVDPDDPVQPYYYVISTD